MEKKQLELLNFMKGVAISAIVLFHLIYEHLQVPDIIATASKFGGAGIHIFFLSSGFGLTLSNLRRPLGWKAFLTKRIKKIYVPYILIVLLSAALPWMYAGHDRLQALLSHVFLYKMFVPAYEISFGAQFWFVSTILQFYFVFPLLEKGRGKMGARRFLLCSCGISLIWMILTAATGLHTERIWGSFFLQYLWEFALGMCLAERYQRGELDLGKSSLFAASIVTLLAVALYGIMALKGGILAVFNDVFGAVAIMGICLVLYRLEWLRPFFCWVNGFSYELYLVHVLVFAACERLLARVLPNAVWCAAALPLAVFAAIGYRKLMDLVREKTSNFL